jgi:hypothetical protein
MDEGRPTPETTEQLKKEQMYFVRDSSLLA